MNVVGLITRGDEFLMVYNPGRGGWELPGGRVEEGETPEDALRRECLEEAGAEIGEPRLIYRLGEDTLVYHAPLLRLGKGEMASALFSEPPERCAFPREEIEIVLRAYREVYRTI